MVRIDWCPNCEKQVVTGNRCQLCKVEYQPGINVARKEWKNPYKYTDFHLSTDEVKHLRKRLELDTSVDRKLP